MAIDPQIRVQVYKRDGYKCRHCNNRNNLHPHHLIYQSQCGKDILDNLITLCYICHNAHHDGFLKIEFPEGANGKVRFTCLRGWKPGGLGIVRPKEDNEQDKRLDTLLERLERG